MTNSYDVLVIGAGVAGLTAAEEAARRGLKVGLAEESMFGGLIVNINHLRPPLEGMPGSGSDLAAELMMRVSNLGAEMVFEPVISVELSSEGVIEVATPGGVHAARSVIVASGARLRKLGVPGEAEFEHRGVSTCADCDAPLFQGQSVMVVGGGDSALQEALVLAEFCPIVHLIHRGAAFSARPEFIEAVRATAAISVRFNTVVEALQGGEALSGACLHDVTSGWKGVEAVSGLFAYVGLEPNIGFLPPLIKRREGLVDVDETQETNCANIFAAGAARSGYGGQLTDAMADAERAVGAISQRLGNP